MLKRKKDTRNPHAVALGRRGGAANTPAQQSAVRANLEKARAKRWATRKPSG